MSKQFAKSEIENTMFRRAYEFAESQPESEIHQWLVALLEEVNFLAAIKRDEFEHLRRLMDIKPKEDRK